MTSESTRSGDGAGPSADEVAERVLAAALGWIDTMALYLGDRLGWYRYLTEHGACTADELAAGTGTSTRYAREWLEQQATIGVLTAAPAPNGGHAFTLPVGAAEVLTDIRSRAHLAPLARMLAAAGIQAPALLEAYRRGTGVSWDQLGPDARESQADMNRPWFDALPEKLAAVAPLEAVLAAPGARIADVGCGAGWSSIALARAHPDLRVVGFDVDAPSLDEAAANAAAAGVSERVSFVLEDGASLATHGSFDSAFAFECIHDLPRPVQVLGAMHAAVRVGGTVIVMDEAVPERFEPPGDDLERLMYGFSLFVCLPDGLSHPDSVGTGTVMRPATLRDYAREAGFSDARILPTGEFGFWRFYELVS
jgi:SAM-dependent methyltransferase